MPKDKTFLPPWTPQGAVRMLINRCQRRGIDNNTLAGLLINAGEALRRTDLTNSKDVAI